MLLAMLPFALLVALVDWQREMRIGAGLLVVAFGVLRLVNRRHPRALARIPPAQLALWSFAVALAHGAGADAGADLSRPVPAADLDAATRPRAP